MKYEKFSREELIERAFYRLSWVLHSMWQEGDEAHSRLGEWLIPDEYVEIGTSTRGGGHREHAVPLSKLRDHAFLLFNSDVSIQDVAKMLRKYLIIVHIDRDEAKYIDRDLKLKKAMPVGWTFEDGDPLARVRIARIEIKNKDGVTILGRAI